MSVVLDIRSESAFAGVLGPRRGRPVPDHPLFVGHMSDDERQAERAERRARDALSHGDWQQVLDELHAGYAAYGTHGKNGPCAPTGGHAVHASRILANLSPAVTGPLHRNMTGTLVALLDDVGALAAGEDPLTVPLALDRDVRRRAHLHLSRRLLVPALVTRPVSAAEFESWALDAWWEAVRRTVPPLALTRADDGARNATLIRLLDHRVLELRDLASWPMLEHLLRAADIAAAVSVWIENRRSGADSRAAFADSLMSAIVTRAH